MAPKFASQESIWENQKRYSTSTREGADRSQKIDKMWETIAKFVGIAIVAIIYRQINQN